MIGLLIAASSAVVGFSGVVLPHQAADGRFYAISSAQDAAALEALHSCGVSDYSATGQDAGRATFQFAVTAARDADCVRSRLPAGARIDAKKSWSN